MSVSDVDEAELVELLGRDVMTTLGPAHLDMVRLTAQHHRQFTDDPEYYFERVVEDVQQQIHDCFIDTSWPRCPTHPNHPLWYRSGWWFADGLPLTKLGELRGALKPTSA